MSKRSIKQDLVKGDFIPNSFQVVNAYVDKAQAHLTPEEFAVLIFTTRHILGWKHHVSDRQANISLSIYENGIPEMDMGGCGLSRKAIIRALQGLERYNLIKRVGDPSDPNGQRWELLFNPDMDALEKRTQAQKVANQQRTAAARGVSHTLGGGGVSDTISKGVSDTTSSGVSDTHNKTHDKHINTYVAATASTERNSFSTKGKKPARDALFNAVAESLFGLKPDAKIADAGYIAKVRGVFADNDVEPSQVSAFVAWYRTTYPNMNMVKDVSKLATYVPLWLASSEKPAAFEIIEYHDSFDDLRGA